MGDRLHRRVSVTVRRDAAQRLSNGRVLYDALFSRVGIQTYGSSIEYRPPEEVFAPASLASLAVLPGVLLHPEVNLGTTFGAGSYPVRGATGERIVEHTDKIHTAGLLCVWDDEWNGLIERDEVGELSLGYTIDEDPTPGTAPDGTRYHVVQRGIVGDHCAGVPRGNAGTARVVTDSARGDRATRAALAEIAAARMDARPLYFDLGQWPDRETTTVKNKPKNDKKTPAKKPTPKTPKADGMAALLVKLGEMRALAPEELAAQLDEVITELTAVVEPDEEAPEPVESEMPEVDAPAPGMGEPEEEEPMDTYKKDEVDKLLTKTREDALALADERADALEVARHVFGRDYSPRKDGKPLSTSAIRLAVVEKLDSKALARVTSRYPAGDRRDTAIETEYERLREQVADAAYSTPADDLVSAINATREDKASQSDADKALAEMAARARKHDEDAARVRAPQTANA